MSGGAEIVVVPGERHVEQLARDGNAVETRRALRTRLVDALMPDTRFADAAECRLVLGFALASMGPATHPRQLDLFETNAENAANVDVPPDPIAVARATGGAAWAGMIAGLDQAIGVLHGRNCGVASLYRIANTATGVLAARSRFLGGAMQALDEALARVGAVDARRTGPLLADAIRRESVERLARILGGFRLRARWILGWEPSELAWWRALDEALSPVGGWARVVLPAFERSLEGSREPDALEELAEHVASGLDAAPESETISAVLGDLSGRPPACVDERVELVQATDIVRQAEEVARIVGEALRGGARVERVVVAPPSSEETVLQPLRRAFADAGIVMSEARARSPMLAAVVVTAFQALEASESLERRAIARILRSGYVEAKNFSSGTSRGAASALCRVADALDGTPTAGADDLVARFTRTAEFGGGDPVVASAIASALAPAHHARTRREHVAAARTLWDALGIGERVGRGGLASFSDDAPPSGAARLERLAIARDVRSWNALAAAVDGYERWAEEMGVGEEPLRGDSFRAEVADFVERSMTIPGAARAAAVRVGALSDFAGEEIDLLVVLDGSGPVSVGGTQPGLVTNALARACGGAGTLPPARMTEVRALAALAVAAASSRRTVLSFAKEDLEGAQVAPSGIVDALLRAGAPLRTASAAPRRLPTEDDLRRARRETEREAFFFDPNRPLSEIVGRIVPSPAAASTLKRTTGGAATPLAVTALERFASCPFQGYAYAVLGAREVGDRAELPDAREEGSIVHSSLAAAFVATMSEWARRPRDRRAILSLGLAAADRVLSAWQGHMPLRAVTRLQVIDAVERMLVAAADDERWDFVLAEQPFGGVAARGDEPWPPLELGDTGHELALRGTLDRLDRAHDGRTVRVIDYKRSHATARQAAASLGETALQVPLYASVASRRFSVPATGAYVATQPCSGGSEARRRERAEQWVTSLANRESGCAESLAPIELRALDLISSVRAGALEPIPVDDAICRTCSMSGGCRKPRFAMAPDDEPEDSE